MPTQAYSFTVHLMNPFDDEELCDRIYGVCDDSTATSDREGRLLLEFDREAESLDNAIRSALADLVSVGATPQSITIETRDLTPLAS